MARVIDFVNDTGFDANLEAALLTELQAKSEQGKNTRFSLRCTDAAGVDCGGILAFTAYGWLLIKVLYIKPHARRQGHGKALLHAAFERARDLGCHSAWLDTSDTEAYKFYRAQAFEDFGTLANGPDKTPAQHKRWFLQRDLG